MAPEKSFGNMLNLQIESLWFINYNRLSRNYFIILSLLHSILIKMRILLIVLLFSTMGLNGQNKPVISENQRIEKILNSGWTFSYFPSASADKGYEVADFDDSRWPAISIPHSWNTYESTGELYPFIKNPSGNDFTYWWKGWGWYRKHFTINPEYSGKKVFLEFEGVQKYCRLWINGKYLGDHSGGNGSFDFDITTLIKIGGDNVLAVAVSNSIIDQLRNQDVEERDLTIYGGIFRDVTITLKNRLYIPMQGSATHEGGNFITTPGLNEKSGVVRIMTWVKNDYKEIRNCMIQTSILDHSGKLVQVLKTSADIKPGELYRFDQTSKAIKNPHLWSPNSPYLYRAVTKIIDKKFVTDKLTTSFGFRWVRWNNKENNLYVNGKLVLLNGADHHPDYPMLGNAIPEWITLMEMKDLHDKRVYNYIRTDQNQNGRSIYDIADQLGFLIDETLPGKDPSFSTEVNKKQMIEMIRRDRNHPSVIFRGMGDETDISKYPNDEDTTRIFTNPHLTTIINGMLIAGTKKNVLKATQVPIAGEPSKLIISSSHEKLPAERSSIAIITVDALDGKGNHVYGAGNTLKWVISGPGTLIGPALYECESNSLQERPGTYYKGMPVSNIIRSTGTEGKIKVTVFSAGLASVSVEIECIKAESDNSVISGPALVNEGRKPLAGNVLESRRLDEIPLDIKRTSGNIIISASDIRSYKKAIREIVKKNNPAIDTTSVEFRVLMELLGSHLINTNGIISEDDFNFNIENYNKSRLIASYINTTKLPLIFREGLRKYYSETIIRKGNEKNAGDEMNWLNWIPSGGIVIVFSGGEKKPYPKETLTSEKNDLADLISAAHPGFVNFNSEARQRALEFIRRMNPYVYVESGTTSPRRYLAEKGEPILIPLYKFIAE